MRFVWVTLALNFCLACTSHGQVVLEERFSYPDGGLPSAWWYEGNAAEIKDGHLFVDADTDSFRVSTIWLDKQLSGNVMIEFDVQVVSSSDTANNINCFLFYSDPEGKPLRESREQRRNATYNHYHKLNGYIFTQLANGNPSNGRFRFRDNPGFKLLEEQFGFECKKGKTYRVRIKKTDNRFQYWVNGEKLCDTKHEAGPVHEQGHFGFRTWHTALWWDNLVITQLK